METEVGPEAGGGETLRKAEETGACGDCGGFADTFHRRVGTCRSHRVVALGERKESDCLMLVERHSTVGGRAS